MEVKNAKALDNGRMVLVDLKRKRAARCAAYFAGTAQALISRATLDQPANKHTKILRSDIFKNGCNGFSGNPVFKNFANLKKSGLPQRFLFYHNGEWNDFPGDDIDLIREAFQTEKFMIEIAFQGHRSLVDFLRMVQIDLETGLQQSIAWIDESGGCFFPELWSNFDDPHGCSGFDGEEDRAYGISEPNGTREVKVHVEIGISGTDSSKLEECGGASISNVKKYKIQEKLNGDCNEMEQDCSSSGKPYAEIQKTITENCTGESKLLPPRICTTDLTSSDTEFGKLVRLVSGRSDYRTVLDIFLSGFGPFAKELIIIGIHRSSLTSISVQDRMHSFQKQIEITAKCRGNANVRHAWYGSSRDALLGIMAHGFGNNEKPKSSPTYGIGIYLAPEKCSHISANYSDMDENGVQHMLLCRVIMGNMELVSPGSEQFHPSSENFDSGVDDIQTPKHYIVWNARMNTHIYPEYLVSFKVPPSLKEYCAGLRASSNKHDASGITKSTNDCSKAHRDSPFVDSMKQCEGKTNGLGLRTPKKPTSPWMTFPMLFSSIKNKIAPESMKLVDLHYSDFKRKKITRDDFIKKLRWIIGDELLTSTLKSLQCKNLHDISCSNR